MLTQLHSQQILLQIADYIWYAADNVCVASNTLNDYYTGTPNDGIEGAPASYLNWGGLGNGPWKVVNVPGIFMNSRAEALIADHYKHQGREQYCL